MLVSIGNGGAEAWEKLVAPKTIKALAYTKGSQFYWVHSNDAKFKVEETIVEGIEAYNLLLLMMYPPEGEIHLDLTKRGIHRLQNEQYVKTCISSIHAMHTRALHANIPLLLPNDFVDIGGLDERTADMPHLVTDGPIMPAHPRSRTHEGEGENLKPVGGLTFGLLGPKGPLTHTINNLTYDDYRVARKLHRQGPHCMAPLNLRTSNQNVVLSGVRRHRGLDGNGPHRTPHMDQTLTAARAPFGVPGTTPGR